MIDIGCEAIDRGSSFGNNRTIVNQGNPANANGKITLVEIYAVDNLTDVEVATFYIVSGNYLSTRDTEYIGSVTGGSKQTKSVSLDVQEGDYLGIYCSAAQNIECDTSGGSGLWHIEGDSIPCSNVEFGTYGDDVLSLYGTGILSKSLSGEFTAIGSVSSIWKSYQSLAGVFSLTGTLSPIKRFVKALSGVLSFTSSLTVWIHYTWVGVSKAIGDWNKVTKTTDDCTKVEKEKGEFNRVEKE